MYVSSKNRMLTPSGPKRRVCVNALDGLTPPSSNHPLKITLPISVFTAFFFSFLQYFDFPRSRQSEAPYEQNQPVAYAPRIAFAIKAGRGAAFLILAGAKRRRWLVLSEFAKYAFFRPDKENPVFERSVLMYVSIKKQDFNAVRPKKTGLRKCSRRAHPALKQPPLKLTLPTCRNYSRI